MLLTLLLHFVSTLNICLIRRSNSLYVIFFLFGVLFNIQIVVNLHVSFFVSFGFFGETCSISVRVFSFLSLQYNRMDAFNQTRPERRRRKWIQWNKQRKTNGKQRIQFNFVPYFFDWWCFSISLRYEQQQKSASEHRERKMIGKSVNWWNEEERNGSWCIWSGMKYERCKNWFHSHNYRRTIFKSLLFSVPRMTKATEPKPSDEAVEIAIKRYFNADSKFMRLINLFFFPLIAFVVVRSSAFGGISISRIEFDNNEQPMADFTTTTLTLHI